MWHHPYQIVQHGPLLLIIIAVDENFEAPGLPLEESDTHMNSSDESGLYEQDITEDSNCLPLQQEDESGKIMLSIKDRILSYTFLFQKQRRYGKMMMQKNS